MSVMIKPIFKLKVTSISWAVHHVDEHRHGAHIKLAINALFGIQLRAIGERLGVLQKYDIDLSSAMKITLSTPVCSSAAKKTH